MYVTHTFYERFSYVFDGLSSIARVSAFGTYTTYAERTSIVYLNERYARVSSVSNMFIRNTCGLLYAYV